VTFIAQLAFAQQSVFEREPNNTPQDAASFQGPAVLVGNLDASDQDAFSWNVSDVDAGFTWTLTFDGVPGRLSLVEVLRVQYTDDGSGVQSSEKLLVLGSRDGRKPVVLTDLLLDPGTYILGIAGGGGGAYRPPGLAGDLDGAGQTAGQEVVKETGTYRVSVARGRDIRAANVATAPVSASAAVAVSPNRPAAFFQDQAVTWYAFDIDEAGSELSWQLEGQVSLGRSAEAILYAVDDRELSRRKTDRQGRFVFHDLGLEPGRYTVQIESDDAAGIQMIGLQQGGVRTDGAEAEPNDAWQIANHLDFSAPVTGRIGASGDKDFFQVSQSESTVSEVVHLLLETEGDGELELCLTDESGKNRQCRRGRGEISLPDLILGEGGWGVAVGRGSAGQNYQLSLESQGQIRDGFEAEPNDTLEDASGMPSKLRVKGRFAGEEHDYFRLLVAEEAQLWRFQVNGDNIHEVALHDKAGRQLQVVRVRGGDKRVRLENLYLLPGTHYIRVSGRAAGDYMVLARPLGQPAPGIEREPNDDVTRMLPLAIGQPRTGLLSEPADTDNYRFLLSAYDHVRLRITPPADGSVAADLYWDTVLMKRGASSKPGESLVLEGVFPPGNYRLALSPVQVSEAEYSVSLEPLPRFSCGADCEPNDTLGLANALMPGLPVQGRANEWRDADWFRLPVFASDTGVKVSMAPSRNFEVLAPYSWEKSLREKSKNATEWQGVIPAGTQAYVKIPAWGDAEYRMQLEVDGADPAAEPLAGAAPGISIAIDNTRVSAYRDYGQRLEAIVELSNPAPSSAEVTLKTAASDYRWKIEHGADIVLLESGEVKRVPLSIYVPPDAYADKPVRISAAIFTGPRLNGEAVAEVQVERGDTPSVAVSHWDLPDALLGGINVAWSALGGRWAGDLGDDVGRDFAKAFDGMAVKGEGLSLRGRADVQNAPELVVELANDEPVEVRGVAISLLGSDAIQQQLAELELYLSADGQDWTLAAREPLLAVRSEQAFTLDTPLSARFAKLRMARFFADQPMPPGGKLGEFKIIAAPGVDISGGQGYNLADPILGGHVVWSLPPLEGQSWDSSVLVKSEDSSPVVVRAGESLDWVIGFHHDRAARIARLEWTPVAQVRQGTVPVNEVEISVSLESPAGPWQSIGSWRPESSAAQHSFTLPADTWARFVRFTVPASDKTRQYRLPAAIGAWEIPTSADYFSILGEWGLNGRAASYELARGLPARADKTQRTNLTSDTAALLLDGQRQTGEVEIGGDEHWYAYRFTPERNSVLLGLAGDPTVQAALDVHGADGGRLPALRRPDLDKPAEMFWEVTGRPGETALVRVYEPPRNVLFLWDTSASVGAYIPVIYSALGSYARGLVPGRDAANLMPFGGNLLLDDWYGDPYVLETVLNDYPRAESSSDAEGTLASAARILGARQGSKSIVLITDAATGRYPPMWRELQGVRPRIFALGLSSEGAFGRNPPREQDLQQDWASVNGGRYDQVMDEIQMEVAFDRAATMLRRPAAYALTAVGSYREAVGPGRLQVRSAEGSPTDLGAVELILDASGSMLQRMDGRRRIEIAREVLTKAVGEYLPKGIPLAMRVFGHLEASSCRTDLEIALGPLVPAAATGKLASINAMNLARTPIADSLGKVAEDLRGASGRKVLLLVTDGEETCDGDPETVIQRLSGQVSDITLNIVGFAIDDPELEARFARWADLGNGEYFSADDRAGLDASIRSALQVPYRVYDTAGELRATGELNGDPIELPEGEYRIVVERAPPAVFEKVVVRGGAVTELALE
jgi:hypothetical protein